VAASQAEREVFTPKRALASSRLLVTAIVQELTVRGVAQRSSATACCLAPALQAERALTIT
jgi:hypothetical protein